VKPIGHLLVPVVNFGGAHWGALSEFASSHDIVATSARIGKRISFLDNHQVSQVKLKSMVHWKIPSGVEAEISAVPSGEAPRRQR